MSVQVLLYGKLLGIEEFLLSAEPGAEHGAPQNPSVLVGRSHWITLLSEVLPRALLSEFGLARVLLGSSGGGQFLLVLPSESRATAEEFFERADAQIQEMSGGRLRLVTAVTENLGDWSVVRKRLNEALARRLGADAAALGPDAFRPFAQNGAGASDEYFE